MHGESNSPVRGPAKTRRIDLGLRVLQTLSAPGACWSCEEIAAWCGCSAQAVSAVEHRALGKLRRELERRGILEGLQHSFPGIQASNADARGTSKYAVRKGGL